MREFLNAELLDEFDDGVLGTPPRIYILGSIGQGDVPANPPKPFLSFREMPANRFQEVREVSKAQRRTFQIYCYDVPGSFKQINAILRRCETRVDAMVGRTSPSGAFCFESLWLGISQDFSAEEYDAVARFATVQLSANQ